MASKKRIVVIDYKLGNLFSVKHALLNIGLDAEISSDQNEINCADALLLPGVGAFPDAMNNLLSLNLIDTIKRSVQSGKPIFGICLGLQLMFSESEEFGFTKGLDLVKGKVKRFNNINFDGSTRKVPQIGWNCINEADISWVDTPLKDVRNGEFMYFVHSYYVEPTENVTLSTTNYEGIEYVSGIVKDNLFACQFHPEKSAFEGLKIYNSWAEINNLK